MRKIIQTKKAPAAIGPYSQAIQINTFLFISGQIPIDTKSGKIPETIQEQTQITLTNIKSIIHKAQFKINDIVKTTIFTTQLKNINLINKIYEQFFIDNQSTFPARSCIEVKALPKNVKIEIEAIACNDIS